MIYNDVTLNYFCVFKMSNNSSETKPCIFQSFQALAIVGVS